MLEIDKMESKKTKTFKKLLKWIRQSPQYNPSRQSQRRKENIQAAKELGISGNTSTKPVLVQIIFLKRVYCEVIKLRQTMKQ